MVKISDIDEYNMFLEQIILRHPWTGITRPTLGNPAIEISPEEHSQQHDCDVESLRARTDATPPFQAQVGLMAERIVEFYPTGQRQLLNTQVIRLQFFCTCEECMSALDYNFLHSLHTGGHTGHYSKLGFFRKHLTNMQTLVKKRAK